MLVEGFNGSSGGGGDVVRKYYTFNTNNTLITSDEILNGIVIAGFAQSAPSASSDRLQYTRVYALVNNGVVSIIHSGDGYTLPIDGTYVYFNYDTTTHKFSFKSKSATYKWGEMDIIITPNPVVNNQ